MRCRVRGYLGVHRDLGGVIADLVDAVVLRRVLEEVSSRHRDFSQPEDVRRARIEVGGQDLQHDLAVFEQVSCWPRRSP